MVEYLLICRGRVLAVIWASTPDDARARAATKLATLRNKNLGESDIMFRLAVIDAECVRV